MLEAAALFRGMTAYTGLVRVEPGRTVTKLDLAWHPGWKGSEQERFYALEGDRLILTTSVQSHSLRPGCRLRGFALPSRRHGRAEFRIRFPQHRRALPDRRPLAVEGHRQRHALQRIARHRLHD